MASPQTQQIQPSAIRISSFEDEVSYYLSAGRGSILQQSPEGVAHAFSGLINRAHTDRNHPISYLSGIPDQGQVSTLQTRFESLYRLYGNPNLIYGADTQQDWQRAMANLSREFSRTGGAFPAVILAFQRHLESVNPALTGTPLRLPSAVR